MQSPNRGGLDVHMELGISKGKARVLQVCSEKLGEELAVVWMGILCLRVFDARQEVGSR